MHLRVLDFRSPLEVLQGTNSYIVPPKVFGCVYFIHTRNVSKLEPKSLKCVFVGYSSTQKSYKCYHPPCRKYFVTIDVIFRESEPYFSSTQIPLQGGSEMEEVMTNLVTLDSHIHWENSMSKDYIQEESARQLDKSNLKRYSRRDKTQKTIMQSIPS